MLLYINMYSGTVLYPGTVATGTRRPSTSKLLLVLVKLLVSYPGVQTVLSVVSSVSTFNFTTLVLSSTYFNF